MPGRAVRRDEAFGRRLVEAMARARVRPGELAAQVGVLPQTVSRWRSGECPDDLRYGVIADALGIAEAWLKTGVGPRSPEVKPETGPERLHALEARLAFLRDQLKAYRDLGQPPSPEILAEWLRVTADLDELDEP